MDKKKILKAIADETRMDILNLLLRHNYCVRALANELHLTEATVSQHLKVLREAGLLVGEKRGYFMHYNVEQSVLRELAKEIEAWPPSNGKIVNRKSATIVLPQKNRIAPRKGNVVMRFRSSATVQITVRKNSDHGNGQCHKSKRHMVTLPL